MVEAVPHCRLYLTLPARPSAALESSLAQTLAEADVACVLLRDDMGPIDTSWDFRLRELTLAHEVAFLIENDAERAESIGADGIHIPVSKRARQTWTTRNHRCGLHRKSARRHDHG